MFDPEKTYEENYEHGPCADFLPGSTFPKIKFTKEPQFKMLGLPLHIPFGVPAGPLLHSKYVNVALQAGFCLPTYKTVRSCAWKSNPWPNVVFIESSEKALFSKDNPHVSARLFKSQQHQKHEQLSISNSFGVPSQDPSVWSQDFQSVARESTDSGQHVVLSFQPSRQKEISLEEDAEKIALLVFETLDKSRSNMVEVNLSCPNEAHAPLYQDLKSTVLILSKIRQVLSRENKIKLIAKIGALDDEKLNQFFDHAVPFLDGLSAINTVGCHITDHKGRAILGSGSLTGGVCGALILEQGLEMIKCCVDLREKNMLTKDEFVLVGVGGISSAQDFKRYWELGVDAVQAATGMMWNLDLAAEIADFLKVSYAKEKENDFAGTIDRTTV